MVKRVNRLSAVRVAKESRPGLHADGDGLYLQVKAGAKSWILRFRYKGKRRDMGLGSAQIIGLADARLRSLNCRRLLGQGIDPIEARDPEARPDRPAKVTFREAFECFFEI